MAEELWILAEEPIRVPFNTKGFAFCRGGKGILGTPVEAHLRLIAVEGANKVAISSVAELRGRVAIESPDQALEFVRLFTSIRTHYLFPEIWYIEPTVADHAPGLGEYSEEYKERVNLKPARSRRKGSGFVVERNLVNHEGELFRATELVTTDGAYTLIKVVVIDEHSPIAYPIYE